MTPRLTVFVPAYNEQANLEQCVQVVCSKMAEMGIPVEILVVDDGSRDATGAIADRLADENADVRVVHHSRNLGIGGAFKTAVASACGEWLILIPADLALHPDELRRYMDAATDADVVVGLRSDRSDYTWLRRLVSHTNIFLIRSLFQMPLRQYQYISMYRMEVLRAIDITYWHSAFFLAEILIKARDLGKRLVEVEIRYAPRLAGKPTGAKLKLVLRTIYDLLHYRLHWKGNRQNQPEFHGR